jgi:uncharacterized protein with von Willebrand factor type A (vWA) domain
VVITVDESGSMAGWPVENAKALALAMAWIAGRQKRWCALVAYSGGTGERLLKLPPGRWDEAKLIGWLKAFLSGGNQRDVPINEMPRYFQQLECPKGKTDVIFITDAQVRLSGQEVTEFTRWKGETKARVITLRIGHGTSDELRKVSDEHHEVQRLDVGEAGVERVLGL